SPPGTTITVSVEPYGARALLAVSDQGPGIPADERTRVFTRFYRSETEATHRTRGAGIGLAIVKEFADRLNAAIAVHSADGSGALLVNRDGIIVNGVLLEGAKIGDKLQRPEIERVLGPNPKPAVLPVAPGVTTSVPTTGFAFPLKNAAGQPIGAYISETDVSP